jgi:hypothetical protein
VLDTFGIDEHVSVLPAPRYEARWLRCRRSPTLPLPPLPPGFHRPLCLCVFWVPLAPGRDLKGGAVVTPQAVITVHHQPYVQAVATVTPPARRVRTGLHRCRGYTTQPIERSHVPTRDRRRGARGFRIVYAGQKFLGSFEALHALRRGTVKLWAWVPRYRPTPATEHEKVRAVIAALAVVGTLLRKAACRLENTHLQ